MGLFIQYPLKDNYFVENPYLIGANPYSFGETLLIFEWYVFIPLHYMQSFRIYSPIQSIRIL